MEGRSAIEAKKGDLKYTRKRGPTVMKTSLGASYWYA